MNSFNKTEAAVFSCRLCFLRAFPFISLILLHYLISVTSVAEMVMHWTAVLEASGSKSTSAGFLSFIVIFCCSWFIISSPLTCIKNYVISSHASFSVFNISIRFVVISCHASSGVFNIF